MWRSSWKKKRGAPRGAAWSPREVVKLRSYAERGLSMREAGILMGRSYGAVLAVSTRLEIHWHGPMGAPKMNRNRKLGEMRKQIARIAAE